MDYIKLGEGKGIAVSILLRREIAYLNKEQ